MPPLRRAVPVLLALTAFGAAPAAASAAGTAASDGQTVVVGEAVPGETNAMTVAVQQPGWVEISDYGTVTPGAGCEAKPDQDTAVRCPLGPGGIVVDTGGGNDVFGTYLDSGVTPTLTDGMLRVALGDGDDTYQGGAFAETVDGGSGNDTLTGRGGADTLDGGPGDDALDGGDGPDVLHGGDGADTIKADQSSEHGVFGDVIDGGAGFDVLDDYRFAGGESQAPAVSVVLDGVANDGRSGEGDNVVGIERIESLSAGTFVGDDGSNELVMPEFGLASRLEGRGGDDLLMGGNAADVLDGGPGNDELTGGFGDDTIVGGPGRDLIAGDRPGRLGGFGNDTIDARDAEVDSVSCGPGTDTVRADPADVVADDCETVDRGPAGPGQPGPGTGPGTDKPGSTPPVVRDPTATLTKTGLRTALKRGIVVRIADAKAGGKVSVSLVLSAKTARSLGLTRGKRPVTVATGSAKASSKGAASVRVRFTAKARTRLARAKRVPVTLKATGVKTRAVTLKR